jgi:hypothetical protein
MSASERKRKISSELRAGDVVLAYQLRVRLNEVKSAPAYGQEEGLKTEGLSPNVYWSVGTVLNPEEAIAKGFPNSYMGWDEQGNRTWQIQGNDRASWLIEEN